MTRRILLILSLSLILTFPIWARTATHNTGQINLEIDDDGGYSGWRSLIWGGRDHLFGASFMLGLSSSNVLDGGRWNEWSTTITPVYITEPGSTANEDGYAVYENTTYNFSIAQHSYAWTNSPNDDFVILKYVVTNTGATRTIYLGIYIDYDVDTDISNRAGSDSSRDLAYIYESNYAGIKLLSGTRCSCNINTFPAPLTDSACWTAMTNGDFDSASVGADDTLVLSAGPFTLASGSSTTFAMAYVMGSSLADLQDNADAAQRRYDYYLGGGAGGASGSEACFIATAACGVRSSARPASRSEAGEFGVRSNEVEVLCKFRDERLLTNAPGRAFVSCYERISPTIARYIENKEPLKAVVRFYLKPIVKIVDKLTRIPVCRQAGKLTSDGL